MKDENMENVSGGIGAALGGAAIKITVDMVTDPVVQEAVKDGGKDIYDKAKETIDKI